ncbi:MAG: hypothetical protein KIT34_09500 [Cyanobacteria bacterium TGS_CYA1]|nr:hypothetical protein [Cyanobacteria bacterium TGS_CYA1]
MDDELDKALQLDILASMLSSDKKQAKDHVETLCAILETTLPEHVKIKRGGMFFSKDRPLEELTVQFEESAYILVVSKKGSVSAKKQKLVRGISLSSVDMQVQECIDAIVQHLSETAAKSSAAREALARFISGNKF